MAHVAQDLRFIESTNFPVEVVNQAAEKEKKGRSGPEYWNMVFWWTRKPLVTARAALAAATLPANINPEKFIRQVLRARVNLKGVVENVPHRENPSTPSEWGERIKRIRVLDPFAGFGSIPLEAVRLGFNEVVAVELLPTAYIFLKAVLEYPKWVAEKGLTHQLLEEIERWGSWIVESLLEDPDIKELYDPDVAAYIGTWEIKCPHCGKYTPLIGNWWLAKVKKDSDEEESGEEEKSGNFKRLAWMDWANGIKVIDLNESFGAKELRAKINLRSGYLEVSGKRYNIRKTNIYAKHESAVCLHCGNIIRYISPKTGLHSVKKTREESEWYVKHALKEWNKNLETYLEENIELSALLESKARPTLLVKVKTQKSGRNLTFEPASSEDIKRLWRSLEKLKQATVKPDIPKEAIPYYESRRWVISYGFNKFYKLFNPRQLLVLSKLVKLIREVGKNVEKEKLEQGWSKEDSFRYAEVVTTYLVISLLNHVRHNCIVTSTEPTRKFVAHALAFRGVAMTWNWVEEFPFANIIGSFTRSLHITVKGLNYLISTLSDSSCQARVVLDDATSLIKVEGLFDLIVTDPPYRDDVPYTELSDFYYVWLKRALSDVSDGRLLPRFLHEAFFRRVGSGYREVRTQWEELALREVGLNPGRLSFFKGGKVDEKEARHYFVDLLYRSFIAMRERLTDDGLLITYYAHTAPEAWEELVSAGWRAGFRVSTAFPVVTESTQRVTARGKVALDTAIVLVWRPGVSGRALADDLYREALAAAEERAVQLLNAGHVGVDLFVGTLSAALAPVTSKEKVVGVDDLGKFVRERIYPAVARALARAIARMVGISLSGGEVRSPEALFYLLAKLLLPKRAGVRVMDRSTVHLLGFGTGLDDKGLIAAAVAMRGRGGFRLLEPAEDTREAMIELLHNRGLDPSKPELRSSVDALHLLEYYALTLGVKEFKTRCEELRALGVHHVDEALRLAEIFASERLLPANDPERELCKRVIVYSTGKGTLEGWFGGA
ncbi:MAG: DUF1156 domain-containing protein [Thermofilaceae archaeon]|nr:DUF1156 domain-containing protein [Thermofilaceae archaeon]MDW8004313.1 DUF1156 domain-containing protein [Thermofilaceae archaeon]